MTETSRVLLTAAVLSALALSVFAWQISRIDASHPARLIGELRLSQLAAVLLAATGAIPIGLVLGTKAPPVTTSLEMTFAIAFLAAAAIVLLREPRTGLLIASAAFVLHALVDLAHRPGLLSPDLGPRWFIIGCATYDVYIAAVCYWARRR